MKPRRAVLILLVAAAALMIALTLAGGGVRLSAAVPRLTERVFPVWLDDLLQRAKVYGRFDAERLADLTRQGPASRTSFAVAVRARYAPEPQEFRELIAAWAGFLPPDSPERSLPILLALDRVQQDGRPGSVVPDAEWEAERKLLHKLCDDAQRDDPDNAFYAILQASLLMDDALVEVKSDQDVPVAPTKRWNIQRRSKLAEALGHLQRACGLSSSNTGAAALRDWWTRALDQLDVRDPERALLYLDRCPNPHGRALARLHEQLRCLIMKAQEEDDELGYRGLSLLAATVAALSLQDDAPRNVLFSANRLITTAAPGALRQARLDVGNVAARAVYERLGAFSRFVREFSMKTATSFPDPAELSRDRFLRYFTTWLLGVLIAAQLAALLVVLALFAAERLLIIGPARARGVTTGGPVSIRSMFRTALPSVLPTVGLAFLTRYFILDALTPWWNHAQTLALGAAVATPILALAFHVRRLRGAGTPSPARRWLVTIWRLFGWYAMLVILAKTFAGDLIPRGSVSFSPIGVALLVAAGLAAALVASAFALGIANARAEKDRAFFESRVRWIDGACLVLLAALVLQLTLALAATPTYRATMRRYVDLRIGRFNAPVRATYGEIDWHERTVIPLRRALQAVLPVRPTPKQEPQLVPPSRRDRRNPDPDAAP